MGSRLQARGRIELSLRFRLLAAAVTIVAVSLVLSGILTWFLVRDLEFQNSQEQLDRSVLVYRQDVVRRECATLTAQGTCQGSRIANATDFLGRLGGLSADLGSDRLLLLDKSQAIVYDSKDSSQIGRRVGLTRTKVVSRENVLEGDLNLDGTDYIGAAMRINNKLDPLGAWFVLLAEPRSVVSSQVVSDVEPRLLLAGGVSLLLSLLVALVLTRTLARPLSELASAAEDIAAGNYARRVGITGNDEIGVVGKAFNKMAEAVERARGLQRDFLANVSHELKTPLTSLIGFSQALVDGSLTTDAERARAAVILHEEANRVLRMSQELLDLARVETGQLSLHMQPVDLGSMLQQALEVVRRRAAESGLDLRLVVPGNLPPAEADPERLHQIIDNLVDNAVKYTPPGSTISVRATWQEDAQSIETVVTNPLGDHAPDPSRIFDRFYRADPSRRSSAGGVGLGLAISRELAIAQKGRLWADLDAGRNLSVHLELRAAQQPAGRTAEQARETVKLSRLARPG